MLHSGRRNLEIDILIQRTIIFVIFNTKSLHETVPNLRLLPLMYKFRW